MECHFALMRHRWAMGVDLHSWDTQMSYGVSLCMYETQRSYCGHFALMRQMSYGMSLCTHETHKWAMGCNLALMKHTDELCGVTPLMRHIWDMGVTLHSWDTQMSYGMYTASILGKKECYWSEGLEYEVKILNFGSKDTLPNWFFCVSFNQFQVSFTRPLTHWGRVTHICVINSLRPSDAYMRQ